MPRIIGTINVDNHIQNLRNEKNITQQDLADSVNVTEPPLLLLKKEAITLHWN